MVLPHAVLRDSPLVLAAKTGTTDGGRDAWFVGFLVPAQHPQPETIIPRITFVVWAGYDDNRAAGLYGGHIHGPIFQRFLQDRQVQEILRLFLQKKAA
jgi:membrane peptidoglycan carboxypeptidase